MGKKAERRIDAGMSEVLQKAAGKMAKLYRIAKAAVDEPKGIIEEVIFPTVSEKWLQTLIQEIEKASGYKGKVRTSLQRSYRFHYRRMVPEILNILQFRCTNAKHQPVMQALNFIRTNFERKGSTCSKGWTNRCSGFDNWECQIRTIRKYGGRGDCETGLWAGPRNRSC
jgi:hypothetical protein